MGPLQEEVSSIAAFVEEKWGQESYAQDALPFVAQRAFEIDAFRSLQDCFNLEILGEWLNTQTDLPLQLDMVGNFGSPPITLYFDPAKRFVIDIYCWTLPDTNIHDHGFTGACSILMGSSVEAQFRFDRAERAWDGVLMGELKKTSLEFLGKGDAFPIVSGQSFIHKVCHVGIPTVSLVIRSAAAGPELTEQYSYYPDALALRYDVGEELEIRKRVAFHRVIQAHKKSLELGYLKEMAARLPPRVALKCLFHIVPLVPLDLVCQQVFEATRSRWGKYVEALVNVAIWMEDQKRIDASRDLNTNARIFSSLIHALGFCDKTLDLIKCASPERNSYEWIEDVIVSMMASGKLKRNLGGYLFERIHNICLRQDDRHSVQGLGLKYYLSIEERRALKRWRFDSWCDQQQFERAKISLHPGDTLPEHTNVVQFSP